MPDATTASAADAAPAQLIPASSPDLPCSTYTEVTELPVHACSQGEPVSIFQSWVAYTDPSFEVDGYFGQNTYDAVISFQLMYGLEPTGVIDDALMYVIEDDHNEVHGEPVILPIDEGECDLADADENC